MTKQYRAELIRALHHAKIGARAYVSSGRPIKLIPERPTIDRLVIGWPAIIPDLKRCPDWVKRPSQAQERSLAVKRQERASPLIKIAEHYFTRIPRS
jgi:hypothetical protein